MNFKGLIELEGQKESMEMTEENQNMNQEQEAKTYTQEELDKLLQSESDRKTTKALETAKAKWEEEYKQKLEEEKSEAEKLASLSAEDRAKASFEEQKKQWEKEKAEYLKDKMMGETIKQLSSEKLPVDFATYVFADTAEEVKTNIEAFKTAWNTALDEAITERLKGKTPSLGGSVGEVVKMTKADFNKLTYKERQSMLAVDPDLMKKLK